MSVTSLVMATSSLALETKGNNNNPSDGGVKGMGNDDGVSGVVSGYTAAASHFDRLFSHYGGHITVLNLVSYYWESLSTHPLNTPYPHTLSTHSINTPSQPTLSGPTKIQ